MTRKVIAIPDADSREDDDADEREQRKPDDLSAIGHDRRGEQRSEGAAGVAADLENRLGKAEAAAGAEVRDARGFRMENGGAEPDEGDRHEDEREIRRERKQDQAGQRRSHAERERERLRMFVGERANDRLQQRSGELVRQGDQADLAVIEPQLGFQDRVNGRDQRLERVVDEMGEAEREENAEDRRGRDRRPPRPHPRRRAGCSRALRLWDASGRVGSRK